MTTKKDITPSSIFLGIIITLIVAYAGYGYTEFEKKVETAVFEEYKIAELRRDINVSDQLKEINRKLDRLIELRITEIAVENKL
jgi:hypothetical protein